MISSPSNRQPVSLILGISMTAAGIVYPVTDSALHHTSPIMIATLRALVGGAFLTAILPLTGSRLPRTRRLWLWAFAIGFGNTTLTQVGISVGTDRAGAAVAAVLANSAPFFVALLARLWLDEAITRLRAAGLLVGFAGVLLVVFSDPGNVAHGTRLVIGFALALVGALGWAAGGLGMRVLTQVLVYLGFNAALGRWPSTRVYAWTFLVPAVAVVIEAVRGTLPGLSATIGVAIVIVGVAIVNHPRAESLEASFAGKPRQMTCASEGN